MDPNACLKELLQALLDGDIDTARDRREDLAGWDGAEPNWRSVILNTPYNSANPAFS